MHDFLEKIKTNDGSFTLLDHRTGEHYHSIHGAIQESKHVFIKAGLDFWFANKKSEDCRLLEVGLGTGLNLQLTAQWYLLNSNINIHYISYEPYPLPADLLAKLTPDNTKIQLEIYRLLKLLHANRIEQFGFFENFTFNLRPIPFSDKPNNEQFDLIYYDAFSPNTAPQMWNEIHLRAIDQSLAIGGIMVTYCIRGHVKRFFKQLGYKVEKLPGAPGKREMLRIIKQ